jgi:hypothetical protein
MLNFEIVPDTPIGVVVEEPKPVRRIITQMAFDLRLSSDERKAIRAAAAANADVDDAYRIKEKATFIDLDDEITAQLLGVMVQAGCIEEERIATILGAEILDRELYRGPI